VKITFIAWERYERRSDLLAQHLGATMHHIYHGQRGEVLQAPTRYLTQGLQTWAVLSQERPDVVFIQNPPIFCVLLVSLYACRYNVQYVIDSHTAAFSSRKWRWSVGLHRLLSLRAAATIVHNKSQERIVKRWGCRYCVIGFIPGEYPAGEHFPLGRQFNVAVISTFGEDEPLDVILEAAASLPEVDFYITGDSRHAAPRLLAEKPDNCRFTGYLPYDQYVGLLRGVDFVMDLTTRDHTLLAGAFEAVCIGTPLIVSNWPILRGYFSPGTVHVSNTVQGICEGVQRARREQPTLRHDISQLREKLQAEWEQEFAQLWQLLQGHYSGAVT